MKLFANIIMFKILVLLTSCNVGSNTCDSSGYDTLLLRPANCTILLPQYKITDSTRYGGNENELTYNVVTQDSVIALSCYVTKYPTEFGYAGFDINRAMKSQKSELIYGIKSPILLSQQITEIDSVKVGYVKYLIETENDKYYEARIFFFRDRRFVNIYITENYSNNTDSASASVSDCIFKSVALNH